MTKTPTRKKANMEDKSSSRLDALKREGWTRQFVAGEPRLSEAVALYRESGFEVLLEPLPRRESELLPLIDSRDGCAQCFNGLQPQFKIIFTRPYKREPSPGDEQSG
jgi:hypothetical protein